MKKKKFVEKEILVFPSDFLGTIGHTCCGHDAVAVSSINRADLKRTAVKVSQQKGIPITEAKRIVGGYYC
ncbi:hypothetical protein A2467_02460 [Candidatus Nomurabacteria bacterium RIFOXYC2_FULL_36_8]|nr:MAG: hypothetical protein UR97_C0008G0008 [Candidatus Nomurabacteria bacterium GW2011_GWE2_36_115]KKP93341.1 MAG: hypothetical protein US00_C0008G0018 [Candidatus Nomurabacteria bacterium GW2011_GWF2_36_126]KKP96393.1 MAG: hypothetical protein US04_C0002G0067 [Candidatus Nomurabacteria bacterium GW2011_GWD2_36_14]KKP99135.1 MAG: hypothetical protein US08_C0003G0029 [Candidatus Nomurabacteria bacterium GW2011_GWF2_36_19]KKQ05036.1 MAG: hypothetical protein US17_C0008G0008 [Candidatus Nomuraba